MEDRIQNKDKQLDELISLVAESKKHFNSQKAYSLFKEKTDTKTGYSAKRRTMNRWLYAAAVFIPFIFLSYFTYKYVRLSADTEQAVIFSEVVVPNGSKTQLTLQDGTKVWVNAGSTISCDKDFGKKSREIKLSGEAYLEVAHLKDCPFIVSTGEVKVKVLGTKFNVNAYKENAEIKVALLEGSVEMTTNNSNSILLAPKDVASYNTISRKTQIHPDATDCMISWIQNKLYFEGETFEQIILTLERNFNVKINIQNASVKDRRFVGDFVNNETIEQIFNVMSSDGKFKYKIKGNVIDIY